MRSLFVICLFCITSSINALAQFVSLPQVPNPSLRVYMSALGSDNNFGDSLLPVATFSKALDLLSSASANLSGEVYSEVVLFEGLYTQALTQNLSKFQFPNRELNVSVRGIGIATLDGTNLSNLSSGSGMVHLLGSGIFVKNINVLYSPANGVRFGYNYNGTLINSQDIVIENVEVAATSGHGILVGIGAINTASPFSLTPKAERFLIQNCNVHDAVNYNTVQTQWGSAIKAWNARHVTVRNCTARDNGGEGIDFDDCDSIDVFQNETFDNLVGIYLDKVTNAWVYSNLVSNAVKQAEGMLFAMEGFTSLLTNYYIQHIKIYNNVLINTRGIAFWQGIYGANQHGYFDHVEIAHNTIIGRQAGNGSSLNFNFETFVGQPAPNVHFSNISMHRNIISANSDSLNNNQLIFASLPVPGFTAAFNIYSQAIWQNMSSATDIIDPQLPTFVSNISEAIPGLGIIPLYNVPTSLINKDFYFNNRNLSQTAAGAFEYSLIGLEEQHSIEILVTPNPNSGHFKLIGLEGGAIKVTDMSGNIVLNNQYK
ncbi:MAG: right-handed parallel beta-helix repeat-containing protein [Flavobacteriales bacterium]